MGRAQVQWVGRQTDEHANISPRAKKQTQQILHLSAVGAKAEKCILFRSFCGSVGNENLTFCLFLI